MLPDSRSRHGASLVPAGGGNKTVRPCGAGTWLVDFTDPANAFARAYSDPRPLVPTQLGGAWSSYWYNRRVYESSITEGLNVFRYQERPIRRQSLRLEHLNPQTQEFSLPAPAHRRPSEGAATAVPSDPQWSQCLTWCVR